MPLLETLIDLICYPYPADQAAIIAGEMEGERGHWAIMSTQENRGEKKEEKLRKISKRQRRRRSTLTGFHFSPTHADTETEPAQISQLHLDFLSFCNMYSVFFSLCLIALNPYQHKVVNCPKWSSDDLPKHPYVFYWRGKGSDMLLMVLIEHFVSVHLWKLSSLNVSFAFCICPYRFFFMKENP